MDHAKSRTDVSFGQSLPAALEMLPVAQEDMQCAGPEVPEQVTLDVPMGEWVTIEHRVVEPATALASFASDSVDTCARVCELAESCTAITFNTATSVCYLADEIDLLTVVRGSSGLVTTVDTGQFEVTLEARTVNNNLTSAFGSANLSLFDLSPSSAWTVPMEPAFEIRIASGGRRQGIWCACVPFEKLEHKIEAQLPSTDMKNLYGLRFHPGVRQAAMGPSDVRLLHSETGATVENWTHTGGHEVATWIVPWANFEAGVVYEVETGGVVIGFLFVDITDEPIKIDLQYQIRVPFGGFPYPVLAFRFAGGVESTPAPVSSTYARFGHTFNAGELETGDEARALRDIVVTVSCKCGTSGDCQAQSADRLIHLPVWTRLAGSVTADYWPYGNADTTLAACISACNSELLCHAVRFVLGPDQQPCYHAPSFVPAATDQTAVLVPMLHRCSPVQVKPPTLRAVKSGVTRQLSMGIAYFPRHNHAPPPPVPAANNEDPCCIARGFQCSRKVRSWQKSYCFTVVTDPPSPPVIRIGISQGPWTR